MKMFTGDEMTKQYKKMMSEYGNLKDDKYVAITYNVKDEEFYVSDKVGFDKLTRVIINLKNANKMKINPKNNRTKIIDKKVWYCFVLQEVNKTYYDPDPFGALMLGYQVGGAIYACKNESDRDKIVKMMNE